MSHQGDEDGPATPSAVRRPRKRRGGQSVTMNEVALLAGVSPSTVSLFLRKPDEVSGSTGAVITEAIAELGYVENFAAGGLAAARTPVVSLIVPSIRNAFFSDTTAALQQGLAGSRQHLILGDTEYSLEREEQLVRMALAWRPTAIVLTGVEHSRRTREMLHAHGATVVEMWDIGPTPIRHAVGFSHPRVGALATRHLMDRGCRSIAFAGGRMGQDRRAAQRADGYRTAMREDGREGLVLDAPGTADASLGEAHLEAALRALPTLDGLVCSNDSLALGILFAAQRRGIGVPSRLRVIGFGDLPFAAHTVPRLSTIRPPSAEIGHAIARLVVGADDAPGARPTILCLDPVLVQRESA